MKQRWFRIVYAILFLTLFSLFIFSAGGITPERLKQLAPQNLWYAAAWLLLLYGMKTLSVFFPSAVLQICAGLIFPLPAAIVVNIAGALFSAWVGYLLGRLGGNGKAKQLLQKHPKANFFVNRYAQRPFFTAYILRVVGCLPLDVVSMLLGALRLNYASYLLGTLCGMLPATVAITVLGSAITEPSSPAFWGSIIATAAVSIASVVVYARFNLKDKTA